jgi:hypothetical protein
MKVLLEINEKRKSWASEQRQTIIDVFPEAILFYFQEINGIRTKFIVDSPRCGQIDLKINIAQMKFREGEYPRRDFAWHMQGTGLLEQHQLCARFL